MKVKTRVKVALGAVLVGLAVVMGSWYSYRRMHPQEYPITNVHDIGRLVASDPGHVDIAQLVHTVSSLTQANRDMGWHAPHVIGRQLPPHTRCIVVSNIEGGLLELHNYIEHWRSQGIIDESLTLVDPQVYVVFVGSVVAGPGRLMSTLAVVVQLMARNPGRVIYVPAQEEFEGLGYLQDLKDELKTWYGRYSLDVLDGLKEWYTSLPQAVYFHTDGDRGRADSGPLLISAYREFLEQDREGWFGNFFTRLLPTEWSSWRLDHPLYTTQPMHPRVAIDASPAGSKTLFTRTDLTLLIPVRSATVWRVWSCAHHVRLKEDEHHRHGSYALITVGTTWATSDIRAYGARPEPHAALTLEGRYALTSGRPLTDTHAIEDAQPDMQMGCTLDLSKSNRAMGRGICVGMMQAINACNAAGGIGGRMLHVTILDDGYVPARARHNIDMFLQEFHASMILLPVGSPTLEAAADLLTTDSLAILFPVTGSPSFRMPEKRAVVCYRPSFQIESKILVQTLLAQQIRNFVFFYQDDEYGKGVLVGARDILKAAGIEQWIEMPYARNATQFKAQVDKLRQSPVEAIGLFGSSQQTQEFMRQVGAEMLSSIQVFANAFTVDASFEHYMRSVLGIPFICTRLVPDPAHDTSDIVREYRAAMDMVGWPYEDNSLEAYMVTSLVCHLLTQLGPTATHQQLLDKIATLDHYTHKGITWTFDPDIRELRKEINIWMDYQDGHPWVPVEDIEKR